MLASNFNCTSVAAAAGVGSGSGGIGDVDDQIAWPM